MVHIVRSEHFYSTTLGCWYCGRRNTEGRYEIHKKNGTCFHIGSSCGCESDSRLHGNLCRSYDICFKVDKFFHDGNWVDYNPSDDNADDMDQDDLMDEEGTKEGKKQMSPSSDDNVSNKSIDPLTGTK